MFWGFNCSKLLVRSRLGLQNALEWLSLSRVSSRLARSFFCNLASGFSAIWKGFFYILIWVLWVVPQFLCSTYLLHSGLLCNSIRKKTLAICEKSIPLVCVIRNLIPGSSKLLGPKKGFLMLFLVANPQTQAIFSYLNVQFYIIPDSFPPTPDKYHADTGISWECMRMKI